MFAVSKCNDMNIFAKKLKRASIEKELTDYITQFEIDAMTIQFRYDGIKKDVVSLEDYITENLETKLQSLKSQS